MRRLSGDLTGFWRTQAICAAVELGVVEALPATAGETARACGLDPSRALRLLRALAELRLAGKNGGVWRLTHRGDCLRNAHPWTLSGAAREYGRFFPGMWESLPQALQPASGWLAPDIFGEVAADPARVESHHRMLMSYALHDYGQVPAVLGPSRPTSGSLTRAAGWVRLPDSSWRLTQACESWFSTAPRS